MPHLRRTIPGTRLCIAALVVGALPPSSPQDEAGALTPQGESLFDGQTLDGWSTLEADRRWWSVEQGALTGGSLEEHVPHNTFLASEASHQNFELTLEIRIQGSEGFINSGIHNRSRRVAGSFEMTGYQVDAGEGWWGKLYDESRRNRVLGEAAHMPRVLAAVRADDWNKVRILAQGFRIRSWINGVAALDYTETDLEIPLDGHLGIQVHGGGKVLVQVRNIRLLALPDTPGAMTWRILPFSWRAHWTFHSASSRMRLGLFSHSRAERFSLHSPRPASSVSIKCCSGPSGSCSPSAEAQVICAMIVAPPRPTTFLSISRTRAPFCAAA